MEANFVLNGVSEEFKHYLFDFKNRNWVRIEDVPHWVPMDFDAGEYMTRLLSDLLNKDHFDEVSMSLVKMWVSCNAPIPVFIEVKGGVAEETYAGMHRGYGSPYRVTRSVIIDHDDNERLEEEDEECNDHSPTQDELDSVEYRDTFILPVHGDDETLPRREVSVYGVEGHDGQMYYMRRWSGGYSGLFIPSNHNDYPLGLDFATEDEGTIQARLKFAQEQWDNETHGLIMPTEVKLVKISI